MNLNNIWEAIGAIDDQLLYDAIAPEKEAKFTARRWWLGIAAAFVLAAISFSTAYTVNAQFREWVISLFQLKETEIVPDSENKNNQMPEGSDSVSPSSDKNHISLYATNTLEDVFAVQYLKSDNYMSLIGPLFYYSDASGQTEYYAAVDSEFIPVASDQIKREITLLGIKGAIDYTRVNYEGILLLQQNEGNSFMLEDGNEAEFMLSVSGDHEVWLTLYKNPQSDQWSYPARYDLETGKVTDILQGIRVNGTDLISYPVLRNWHYLGEGRFVLSLGQTLDDTEAYLVDTSGKEALPLSELTGISSISSAKVVEGKLLLLETLTEENFNYYCYDYTADTLTEIYRNAGYWIPAEQNDNSLMVRFSGGRYDFIKESGRIYLVDEFTGARLTVEGITEELAENLIINSDNDKILVSSFGEDVIQQLGVIDIKAGKFYLLNRENQPGIHEYSIGWNDADHVMINATTDNWSKSQVYLYSLINK